MIVIRDHSLGKGVFATDRIEPGRVILRGWGPRVQGGKKKEKKKMKEIGCKVKGKKKKRKGLRKKIRK